MVLKKHRIKDTPTPNGSLPVVAPAVRKRKRKMAQDYHDLANEHGFEWIGVHVPHDTVTPTTWRCKAKGHIWVTRYNKIYDGRLCPYCCRLWRKVEEDYHAMASRHGVTWVGPELPENVRIPTIWALPDGTEFTATYRTMFTRTQPVGERPNIALRGHEDADDTV
jgi:hypothetical protein